MAKNFSEFIEESQSPKCPKGHRFDTKLKSCVPTKRYPYYPYGIIGRNREEPKNGNGNGNGNNGHERPKAVIVTPVRGNGSSNNGGQAVTTRKLVSTAAIAKLKGFEGDPCSDCGQLTLVRNGTCLKCQACGATSGCS